MGQTPATTDRIRDFLHHSLEFGFQPIARGLAVWGVTPNHVSLTGAAITLASAGFIAIGELLTGGIIFIVGGSLDTLDGTLARVTGRASLRGAFIDSMLDRVSEGVVFAALTYHFAAGGNPINAAIVVVALLGSMIVSYARARAEVLNIECNTGVATRGERVLVLGIGMIVGCAAIAVYILAIATAYTALQRGRTVLRELPQGNMDSEG